MGASALGPGTELENKTPQHPRDNNVPLIDSLPHVLRIADQRVKNEPTGNFSRVQDGSGAVDHKLGGLPERIGKNLVNISSHVHKLLLPGLYGVQGRCSMLPNGLNTVRHLLKTSTCLAQALSERVRGRARHRESGTNENERFPGQRHIYS